MATGRIGVTPNLRTRWSKAPAGGTTSLSGLDDNSVSLVYDAGFEAVYRNGVLLSRGNDYTATNGTTITLIDATIAGDIIEVFANQAIPLTSTYTQAVADGKFINNTLVDAKGDILTATAADTPARLAVGSNDQVLTADSSTATGLKWSTLSVGSQTELATGSLSGTSVTISSISQDYKDLRLYLYDYTNSSTGGAGMGLRVNSDTSSIYNTVGVNNGSAQVGTSNTNFSLTSPINTNLESVAVFEFYEYTNTTASKKGFAFYFHSDYNASPFLRNYTFAYQSTNAITSLNLYVSSGSFASGTYKLIGIK